MANLSDLASNVAQFFQEHNPFGAPRTLQSPQPKMSFDQQMASKGWTKRPDGSFYQGPGVQAAPVPQPTQAPSIFSQPQAPDPNFRFAYENLPRDNYYAQNGPRPGFQPAQPPKPVADLIREFFPHEATAAAAVMASENATFDPNRPDNVNSDGSPDRGIPQINKGSFDGLMQRQGRYLKSQGISSFDDMRDPRKSFIVASLIHLNSQQANPQSQGWGPWFGWQDTGFNINNNLYSAPHRGKYEVAKKEQRIKNELSLR